MPHAYTEDQLVEQPAIGLFAELSWDVASPPPNAGVAGEPRDAGLLGRETKGEAVLESRLRAALERLNPVLPPEAITAAIDELTRDRSTMLLEQANREVYRLLKEGIPVSVAESDSTPGHTSSGLRPASPQRGEWKGGQTTVRVWVIDWEQPANNDFLLVSQLSATDALYTCRPAGFGRLRQRPAAGGHRVEEARRACARGVRREKITRPLAKPNQQNAVATRMALGSTAC